MKNIVTVSFRNVLIILFTLTLGCVYAAISINAENKREIVLNDKVDDYKYVSYPLPFALEIDSKSTIREYSGEIYKGDRASIMELQINDEEQSDDQIIRIIPVDATNSLNSLNLVERFIFSKHGMIQKSEQYIQKFGEFEIAQISFKSNTHGLDEYQIFAGIKVEDIGWIIANRFILEKNSNSIFGQKDIVSMNKMHQIINDLKVNFSKPIEKNRLMTLLDDSNINEILLDINSKFNGNFQTTF